jgi:TP901 family phage tail tape measure protein
MNLGSAHGEIAIDYTGQAAVGAAMRDLNALGTAGGNLGQQLGVAGKAMGIAGAAIGAPLVGAGKLAVDFGREMANVNSILQLTPDEIAALGDQVQALSPQVNKAPAELAAALYDISSSGFAGQEGLAVLEAAAKGANAGLTSTATSARAISSVLNAYGLEASEAGRVSDVLFQTVNDGVLTYEQLANNMGNTIPIASALGVSIEELGAGYATMTTQGMNASAAETNLAAIMKSALNPTAALTTALEAHGTTAEEIIAEGGLPAYLEFLEEAAGGSNSKMFDLLGTQEAMNGVTALGVEEGNRYLEFLENQKNASEGAGATQDALNKQMESSGFALDRMSVAVQAAGTALGETFDPAIRAVATLLGDIGFAFAELNPKILQSIGMFGALSSGSLIAAGGLAFGASKVLEMNEAFTKAGLSMKKFILGMGLLGAILGVGVLAYTNNWLGFGDAVNATLARARTAITKFGAGFKAAFDRGQLAGLNTIANGVQAFGDALLFATGIDITGFTDRLAAGIDAFGDSMQQAMAVGTNPLHAAINSLGDALIAAGFPEAGQKVLELSQAMSNFGAELDASSAAARDAGYSDLAAGIIGFGDALEYVTGLPVADFFGNVADAVQTWQGSMSNALENGLNPLDAALNATRDTIDSLVGVDLGQFFDDAGAKVAEAADAIGSFAGAIRDGNFDEAGQMLQDFGEAAQVALQDFSDFAGEQLQNAVNAIGDTISEIDLGQIAINVGDWIMGRFEDVKTFLEAQTGIDIDALDLGDIVLNVGRWLIDAGQSISEAIATFIGQSSGNSMGGPGERGESGTASAGIPLGEVAVSIGTWLITSVTDLASALGTWLDEQWSVSKSFVSDAAAKGEELGRAAGTALGQALSAAMGETIMSGTAGGGIGTGEGPQTPPAGANIGANFGQAFVGFLDSFVTSAKAALDAEFATARGELEAYVREKRTDLFDGITDELLGPIAQPVQDIAGATLGPLGDGKPNSYWGSTGETEKAVSDTYDTNVTDPAMAGAEGASRSITDNLQDAIAIGYAGAKKLTPIGGIIELFDDAATAEASSAQPKIEEAIFSPVQDMVPGAVESGMSNVEQSIGTEMKAQAGETNIVQSMDDALAGSMAAQQLTQFATALGEKMNEAVRLGFSGTADSMGGPGERGEAGTASAGIVSQIVSSFVREIQAAPIESFSAIGTGLMTRVSEAIDTAISGAATSQDGVPAEHFAPGEGMGAGIVTSLAQSIATSITSAPIEQFAGIGTALSSKISASITAAMGAAQMDGAQLAGSGDVAANGGGIGASLVTSLAQSISTAIAAAPIEQFAAVGTALSAKISQAINTAMSGGGGGGGTEGGQAVGAEAAGGIGAQIATAIASQIAAAITSAPIEAFAAIGEALRSKISEVITSAMSTSPSSSMVEGGMTGTGGGSGGGIGDQIATMIASEVAGADWTSVETALKTGIGTAINNMIVDVNTLITLGMSDMMTAFANGFTNIQTVVTNGMTAIQNVVNEGVSGIQTSIQAIIPAIEQISTAVGEAINNMATTIQTAFSEMQATVDAAVSGIQASVQAIIPALEQTAAAAGAAAAAIGQAIVGALDAAVPQVAAAAGRLAAAASDAIAAALQVSSPSKVVWDISEGVPDAMVGAFNEGQLPVSDAAANLGDAATTGMETGIADTCQIGESAVSELASCIDESAGTVTDSATDVGAALPDAMASGVDENMGVANDAALDAGTEMTTSAADGMTQTQPITDAVGAMGDAAASALEEARGLFEEYGMTFGNDLGAALEASTGNIMGNANMERLVGLGDEIRKRVEERANSLRDLGDRIRERHGLTADRLAETGRQTMNINLHSVLELDSEVLDDRIIETAVEPMMGAFDRVGLSSGDLS